MSSFGTQQLRVNEDAMDLTLTFRSSVEILIMLWNHVEIVDVTKGSCGHLEFTKREERVER
jgi:hypothetical protein